MTGVQTCALPISETTAKWEMELTEIAQGKSSKEEFLNTIEYEIRNELSHYKKE